VSARRFGAEDSVGPPVVNTAFKKNQGAAPPEDRRSGVRLRASLEPVCPSSGAGVCPVFHLRRRGYRKSTVEPGRPGRREPSFCSGGRPVTVDYGRITASYGVSRETTDAKDRRQNDSQLRVSSASGVARCISIGLLRVFRSEPRADTSAQGSVKGPVITSKAASGATYRRDHSAFQSRNWDCDRNGGCERSVRRGCFT
jgi:hypothetical protein